MASPGVINPTAEQSQAPTYMIKKKFKTSELPLTASQRSTIEGLQHVIKKKGVWDTLRKKVWSEFIEGEDKKTFTERINELAEAEIDRDPSLLSRERGKAAAMMQGPIDRTDIYKGIETCLERVIAKHLGFVHEAAREVRRAEIGEELAAQEEARGNKTDEEYAQEIAAIREAKEALRKQEEARKRRQEEKLRLQEEEERKRIELERLRKADLRRKQALAEQELREKERKEREEAERLEEQEARERAEQQERIKREHTTSNTHSPHHRYRSRRSSLDRYDQSRETSRNRTQEAESELPTHHVDEKALEEAALELLLKEGRELAARSGPKVEVERSNSLEPPHRKYQALKSKSENLSPRMFEDRPYAGKSEAFKPRLSYSAINTSLASPASKEKLSKDYPRTRSPERDGQLNQKTRRLTKTERPPSAKERRKLTSVRKGRVATGAGAPQGIVTDLEAVITIAHHLQNQRKGIAIIVRPLSVIWLLGIIIIIIIAMIIITITNMNTASTAGTAIRAIVGRVAASLVIETETETEIVGMTARAHLLGVLRRDTGTMMAEAYEAGIGPGIRARWLLTAICRAVHLAEGMTEERVEGARMDGSGSGRGTRREETIDTKTTVGRGSEATAEIGIGMGIETATGKMADRGSVKREKIGIGIVIEKERGTTAGTKSGLIAMFLQAGSSRVLRESGVAGSEMVQLAKSYEVLADNSNGHMQKVYEYRIYSTSNFRCFWALRLARFHSWGYNTRDPPRI
ncbi:MAG: hypothetical protein LQ351_003224 [Letrouitia transgressa]|nr:MAG: hypothetical protein LQ351_003224 [Letrouitia transgressa]